MNSGKIGRSTRFIELWPLCDSFHSFQSNTATVILLRQTSFQIFRHFRCSLRVMNSTEKKKSKNNQITVINVMIWATWTCGHLMILRWWYDRFKWTRFWTFFFIFFKKKVSGGFLVGRRFPRCPPPSRTAVEGENDEFEWKFYSQVPPLACHFVSGLSVTSKRFIFGQRNGRVGRIGCGKWMEIIFGKRKF